MSSSCATPPPLPVDPATQGGGAAVQQSPVQQNPVQAGGPVAVPTVAPVPPTTPPAQAVAAAAAVQPVVAQPVAPAAVVTAPVVTQPAPVAAPVAAPAAPTTGGGATADIQSTIAALQQSIAALTQLLQSAGGGAAAVTATTGGGATMSMANCPMMNAAAGASTVQAGGATAATSSLGAAPSTSTATDNAISTVLGGGAPSKGDEDSTGSAPAKPKKPKKHKHHKKHGHVVQQAPTKGGGSTKSTGSTDTTTDGGGPVGNGNIAGGQLTVKGKAMAADQRANIGTVLDVGKRMGANEKVMESAVATMIQESTAHNLHGGDRDSQGLFQQRPSQGWGTVAQVTDPVHAAGKYFEQAIANDKNDHGQSLTHLAQSVQRSGFPDAYAQWDGEAKKIVAQYMQEQSA